jgi:hypothetical protein
MNIDDITFGQLKTLRSEAGVAGDHEMVKIIDVALAHSTNKHERKEALESCATALQAAIDAKDIKEETVKVRVRIEETTTFEGIIEVPKSLVNEHGEVDCNAIEDLVDDSTWLREGEVNSPLTATSAEAICEAAEVEEE